MRGEIKVGQTWTANDGRPMPFVIQLVSESFVTVSRPDGTCQRRIRISRLMTSGRSGYRMLKEAPCPENP